MDEIWYKDFKKRRVYRSVIEGQTNFVIDRLEELLLILTPTENTLLDLVNSDGSTLLHVAAIGGNIEAVNMLVERNPELLLAKDKEGHIPLALSVSNMHIKTSKCLAKMIINKNYDAILPKSDAMLTALAQNFPRELKFWERRVLCVLPALFYHILMVLVRFFFEDTFQIYEDATNLLSDVCFLMNKILIKDNSSTYHQYHTTSTFEATRRNASTFIRCIMRQFPDAIWSTNEDGHDFIQYSVISRSEKIYNLLYEMSEHKNIYKTNKDSSGNNLLHLAARLAPTNKLNLISGAALQIQRELQWFKVSTLTNENDYFY
ncbi:ankyrin repeat-containing domain, PGG domain protein [Tanacetum coccineum]